MKKRSLCNTLILLSIIAYAFIYQFLLLDNLLMYVEFITASFFIFIMFIAFLCFGFRKEKDNVLKKHINKSIVMFVVTYFSVIYFLGLLLGFLKNSYSLRFVTLLNNIIAPFITIICTELFRYIMIRANKDRKLFPVIVSLVIGICEILYSIKLVEIISLVDVFEVITSVFLPIICKNLFLGYLCYQVGYKPCLLYRIFIELYVFIVPIVPDIGKYLTSMIGIAIPILLYVYFSRVIDEYYCGIQYDFSDKEHIGVSIVKVCSLLLFAGLVYGFLPFYLLGIASESMAPFINKGDAVILHKTKKNIKIGDVIAFKHDGRVIVHRLVETVNVDGRDIYITKGDANNAADNYNLKDDDIIGEVKFVVPYLGYPSLFFSSSVKE